MTRDAILHERVFSDSPHCKWCNEGFSSETPCRPRVLARQGLPRGTVYVASRASVPARPAMWKALRAAGLPIRSTWIDEAGPGQTVCLTELWDRVFREIAEAHALLLYVHADDLPLQGAFLEVGGALMAGKPVGVVLHSRRAQAPLEEDLRELLGGWVKHRGVQRFDTAEQGLWALSGVCTVCRLAPSELPSRQFWTRDRLCRACHALGREEDGCLLDRESLVRLRAAAVLADPPPLQSLLESP